MSSLSSLGDQPVGHESRNGGTMDVERRIVDGCPRSSRRPLGCSGDTRRRTCSKRQRRSWRSRCPGSSSISEDRLFLVLRAGALVRMHVSCIQPQRLDETHRTGNLASGTFLAITSRVFDIHETLEEAITTPRAAERPGALRPRRRGGRLARETSSSIRASSSFTGAGHGG